VNNPPLALQQQCRPAAGPSQARYSWTVISSMVNVAPKALYPATKSNISTHIAFLYSGSKNNILSSEGQFFCYCSPVNGKEQNGTETN
jgi:hypothetical protein